MKIAEVTIAEAAIFRDMLNARLIAAAEIEKPVQNEDVPYVMNDDMIARIVCPTNDYDGGFVAHVLSEILTDGPFEPFNYAPETIATLIAKFPKQWQP